MAAQRIAALEAEFQGAVRDRDFRRAGALHSEITAVREALDSEVKPMPAAGHDKVSAAGQGHTGRNALKPVLVAEPLAPQRILALQAELRGAVQGRDFGRAETLHSQIVATWEALDRGTKPTLEAEQGAESAAAQRIDALEAELRGAVRDQDYGRAGALQSQIAAVREALDRAVKPMPVTGHDKVSAAGQGHTGRSALEPALVAESIASQRIDALEAELRAAVLDNE